ncbi:hypothetical protein ID866_10186 [Astraeus odoratus]|nr:hypothetical protein ID866_10186 [Astraeus odoratus]
MSTSCCTPSPHEVLLAKTMDAHQCMEAKWHLISEGELNPVLNIDKNMAKMQSEKRAQEEAKHLVHKEAVKKAWEEAERQAEEAHKVQEEVEKKEKEEREAAAWKAREAAEAQADKEQRAREAAEVHADDEWRALEDRLWEEESRRNAEEVVGLQVIRPSMDLSGAGPSSRKCSKGSGMQDSCSNCCSKGIHFILGAAKGKMTACEACCHAKTSCSWSKKTARETCKQKLVGEDDKEEMWSHFTVPTHLMEDHQDALGALMTMLDMLSIDFLAFWQDSWTLGMEMLKAMAIIASELWRANDLKEEMGRSKAKGKEKAKEEGPRRRTEDNNRDMEMGRAGPSFLV